MVDTLLRNSRASAALATCGGFALLLALAAPATAQNAPAGAPAAVTPVTSSDAGPSGTQGNAAGPAGGTQGNAGGAAAPAAAPAPVSHLAPVAPIGDVTGTVPPATVQPIPTVAPLPALTVPADIVQAAIDRNDVGDAKVKQFLVAGDNTQPQTVTDRARSLVHAVRDTKAGQDPQQFLDISQRIATVAKSLEVDQVQKVEVSTSYRPGPDDKGFKFGAAGAAAPPRFALLTPQDPLVKGVDMRVINSPGGNSLTGSGVIGVRSFQVAVPNGEYRVILLTGNPGPPNVLTAPFGSTIKVNAVERQVASSEPSKWGGNGTLDTPPAAENNNPPLPGSDSGVTTHQSGPAAAPNAPAGGGGSAGGAIMITAQVADGHLNVSFTPAQDQPNPQTYIVGMIAESTNHPSGLQGIDILNIESQVMAEALNLSEPPRAGQGSGAALDPQGSTAPPSNTPPVPVASPT